MLRKRDQHDEDLAGAVAASDGGNHDSNAANGTTATGCMRIKEISIRNFRLLKDVTLCLEERTTVIVGRNNSGKTSLTELFRRLLSDSSPRFRLEDFSLAACEQFWEAYAARCRGRDDAQVRKALPSIHVSLRITYDREAPELGPLVEFIVDLAPACMDALLEMRYELADGKLSALFEGLPLDRDLAKLNKREFFRILQKRIPRFYGMTLQAVDPNDPTNVKTVEWSKLRVLIQSGFINAQRGLDDATHTDRDILGKLVEALFKHANSESAYDDDRKAARALEDAVNSIQSSIDTDFNLNLEKLLPAFNLFGYPGLSDPDLRTETTLDVERLLTDHTKIRYAGLDGVSLPETYNGLGARNLIFILLQLLQFFKAFQAKAVAPGIHLVFIEEPEAHLHPQMAEVFIRKLAEIAEIFAARFNEGSAWPVQFVVSTHSTHMANAAPFDAMRYFLAAPESAPGTFRETRIKDLRQGLSGTPVEDRKFLHQYMTLTRCDLLFADKAILIEGCSERLLLPKMIEKLDAQRPDGPNLSSQYVSVVEVSGAYAHKFFGLLEFLELRTLIVTDLDSAKRNAQNRLAECRVSDGTHTTNGCLKAWFDDNNISPAALIEKSETEKTRGLLRITYQVPETAETEEPCGRTFEDTFILANPTLFKLKPKTAAQTAWKLAKAEKKTEFALRHAIERTEWNVPRYLREGLCWLAEGSSAAVVDAIRNGDTDAPTAPSSAPTEDGP